MHSCSLPVGCAVRLSPALRLLPLLLALTAAPLRANPPIYNVTNLVHAGDLSGSYGPYPVALTGLNAAGQACGYLTLPDPYGSTPGALTVGAFLLDPAAGATNLSEVVGSESSVATCLGAGGTVAGVFWAGPDRSTQDGFVYQPGGGGCTFFRSPASGSLAAVVAVSPDGTKVVGTYFDGTSPYQRAFLWTGGGNTIDLGDLGDYANSFVWPASVNDAGQVAGTLYTAATGPSAATATAFQWQNGAMSALDADGQFDTTVAAAQDAQGRVAGLSTTQSKGTHLQPRPGPTPPPRPTVPGGFFWTADDGLTDLGDLGGGGTVPFSLQAGVVTGTSYAPDNTLHLFSWQAGASALTDLGAAQLEPGDTSFLAADGGTSAQGGLVTDAQGTTHVALAAGPAGALVDLGTLLPAYQATAYPPDTSNGQGAWINAAGRVAFASQDPQDGTPVLVVVDPQVDTNNNGLPDAWEQQYFPGQTNVDPDADADGDGVTNWQEYQNGTDPTDFYDGQTPFLGVVSGGDQRGQPGSWLPVPLSVRVNAGQANAPLTFTVTAGTALLSTTNGGATSASLAVNAVVPFTYSDGTSGSVAQVYVFQPTGADGASGNALSTITVTAQPKGGAPAGTTTTTAIASNPELTPPSAPVLVKNTATTADITWTPSDLSLATLIEVSTDQGTTWSGVGTVPPGLTATTVYRLTPGQAVLLRASTVGYDGGGSATNAAGGGPASGTSTAPGGSMPVNPVEAPVLLGESQFDGGPLTVFPGFDPTEHNYYLVSEVDDSWTQHEDNGSSTDILTIVDPLADPINIQETFTGRDGYSAGLNPLVFEPSGDDYGSETYDYQYPYYSQQEFGRATVTEQLSSSCPLADMEARAARKLPPFTGARQEDPDGAYVEFLPGRGGSYILEEMQYQFRCNADPNGQVTYDIVFTPFYGAVQHEVHTIPTNGATVVPPQPLLLDPTRLYGGQNGSYTVRTLVLEPDDADAVAAANNGGGSSGANHPDAGANGNGSSASQASLSPDPAQATGVRGAMVDSYLLTHPPANPAPNAPPPQLHFVSPKAANDWVNIEAIPFDEGDRWQVTKDDPALPDPPDLTQYVIQIPRDVAGHYTLTVVQPDPSTPTGQTPTKYVGIPGMPTMSVWIVWAKGYFTQTGHPKFDDTHTIGSYYTAAFPSGTDLDGYWMRFDIVPKEITYLNTDIPNFDLPNSVPAPHASERHLLSNKFLSNGASSMWDVSQRMRVEVLNPNGLPRSKMVPVAGRLWDHQPVADDHAIDFPNATDPDHDTLGTDDYGGADASDPYRPYARTGPASSLNHPAGSVTMVDGPNFSILTSAATAAAAAKTLKEDPTGYTFTVDARFGSFVRLQIGNKWYRVADDLNWHHIMKAIFDGSQWRDNNSESTTNP